MIDSDFGTNNAIFASYCFKVNALLNASCYIWYKPFVIKYICGLFYQHGLTLIPAWISNHMPSKAWDEITYPFLNFNYCTVDVCEWISNFIPQFIMHVITYPCWDES